MCTSPHNQGEQTSPPLLHGVSKLKLSEGKWIIQTYLEAIRT